MNREQSDEPEEKEMMVNLRVKWAELPSLSLRAEFLVQVLSPVPLIPIKIEVPMEECIRFEAKDVVKMAVLDFYHKATWAIMELTEPDSPTWEHIPPIADVDLIECDLLVPKDEQFDGSPNRMCSACGSHERDWNKDEVLDED